MRGTSFHSATLHSLYLLYNFVHYTTHTTQLKYLIVSRNVNIIYAKIAKSSTFDYILPVYSHCGPLWKTTTLLVPLWYLLSSTVWLQIDLLTGDIDQHSLDNYHSIISFLSFIKVRKLIKIILVLVFFIIFLHLQLFYFLFTFFLFTFYISVCNAVIIFFFFLHSCDYCMYIQY